ncbi:cobalt/nickel transport system ATP-binding protein [Halanaerobium congolense]|jgi:cobalt/nickel transport system ATP-binding protein|uniref:Cobalt/nickel transport system ATP-binding protein n=1 Tax=Halanaerobium congolense TaxID=54121 RepID=A0A1M7LWW1_9FIRM|nr:energy-coupling factor ABC transporter ATP-binding protein [Halanaerobium congolense]PUU92074.1 MAG: cobalt/nickel transport system ATP-binding protein [Halanaerobium sp.]TDX46399.1 cobalt/nickel transport system ATP-binding protein [Halanaerobium congolense]SDH02869.1 cobalt/nickel transport system ATP-binding protein [Halanaerobium congolense]SDJ05461.1 cobalt/nickel transport system ATP-binding protein [Halanaerobium congolense]SET43846.1 cobalt/nickel transport system ATP-binding protei
MIKLENIYFEYENGNKVLEAFDFEIKAGERIALKGSNGAGKTTVFKLIMGLIKAQKGKLHIFGKERKKEKDFLEVRERVGYLFQDSDNQLFCPTVEEDIAFGPINLGKSRSQAKKIVEEKLKLVEMEGFEKKASYNLSQGQKKIIAFASVLAMEPELLLLDEPFASLDKESAARMVYILKKISQPFVLVSHNDKLSQKVIDKSYSI